MSAALIRSEIEEAANDPEMVDLQETAKLVATLVCVMDCS